MINTSGVLSTCPDSEAVWPWANPFATVSSSKQEVSKLNVLGSLKLHLFYEATDSSVLRVFRDLKLNYRDFKQSGIIYLKVSKRVDLKSSHHKNKICNYVKRSILTEYGDHFVLYPYTKSYGAPWARTALYFNYISEKGGGRTLNQKH